MRQSELFTKTRKETPSGEVSRNANLLIRAGYIDKLAAGVYTYLPLGLRVLKNIENIIREEMNKAGGQEIVMPALSPKENWETTGRWESLDVLYKVKDFEGREYALGPTHEEIIVPLVKQFISSYNDLPFSAYQFQTKFRMEKRAKSGLLRGREFYMKDLYSFHRDEADLDLYYGVMRKAYSEVFKRCGIGHKTFITFASGGTFSKFSHEFQTISPTGEDTIYLCDRCSLGINKEIFAKGEPASDGKDSLSKCPECGADTFKEERAIEVGNIFKLNTKYSDPFSLKYKDAKGELQPVIMGCYGIGLGRVMGAIVEALADDQGIVWPETVSPYKVHLVSLPSKSDAVAKASEELYKDLRNEGVQVLYDDRDVSAGIKFADADLMGIPYRVVISEKTLAEGQAELKVRQTGEVRMMKLAAVATELD